MLKDLKVEDVKNIQDAGSMVLQILGKSSWEIEDGVTKEYFSKHKRLNNRPFFYNP